MNNTIYKLHKYLHKKNTCHDNRRYVDKLNSYSDKYICAYNNAIWNNMYQPNVKQFGGYIIDIIDIIDADNKQLKSCIDSLKILIRTSSITNAGTGSSSSINTIINVFGHPITIPLYDDYRKNTIELLQRSQHVHPITCKFVNDRVKQVGDHIKTIMNTVKKVARLFISKQSELTEDDNNIRTCSILIILEILCKSYTNESFVVNQEIDRITKDTEKRKKQTQQHHQQSKTSNPPLSKTDILHNFSKYYEYCSAHFSNLADNMFKHLGIAHITTTKRGQYEYQCVKCGAVNTTGAVYCACDASSADCPTKPPEFMCIQCICDHFTDKTPLNINVSLLQEHIEQYDDIHFMEEPVDTLLHKIDKQHSKNILTRLIYCHECKATSSIRYIRDGISRYIKYCHNSNEYGVTATNIIGICTSCLLLSKSEYNCIIWQGASEGATAPITQIANETYQQYVRYIMKSEICSVIQRDVLNAINVDGLFNYIVHGPTGCGKSVIIIIEAYLAHLREETCIVMEPTRILAKQMYDKIVNGFTDIIFNSAMNDHRAVNDLRRDPEGSNQRIRTFVLSRVFLITGMTDQSVVDNCYASTGSRIIVCTEDKFLEGTLKQQVLDMSDQSIDQNYPYTRYPIDLTIMLDEIHLGYKCTIAFCMLTQVRIIGLSGTIANIDILTQILTYDNTQPQIFSMTSRINSRLINVINASRQANDSFIDDRAVIESFRSVIDKVPTNRLILHTPLKHLGRVIASSYGGEPINSDIPDDVQNEIVRRFNSDAPEQMFIIGSNKLIWGFDSIGQTICTFDIGQYHRLSDIDLMQLAGRAGRKFGDISYVVIACPSFSALRSRASTCMNKISKPIEDYDTTAQTILYMMINTQLDFNSATEYTFHCYEKGGIDVENTYYATIIESFQRIGWIFPTDDTYTLTPKATSTFGEHTKLPIKLICETYEYLINRQYEKSFTHVINKSFEKISSKIDKLLHNKHDKQGNNISVFANCINLLHEPHTDALYILSENMIGSEIYEIIVVFNVVAKSMVRSNEITDMYQHIYTTMISQVRHAKKHFTDMPIEMFPNEIIIHTFDDFMIFVQSLK
jgi:hypothetical protein